MRSLSMLHRRGLIVVLSCLLTGCSMGMAQTGENNADEELLRRVSERLLAVMTPVPGYVWPPVFKIVPDPEIQAHAEPPKDDQNPPLVVVNSAFMTKVIQGDADRLALILGHELGHIALRHITTPKGVGQTPLVDLVIRRDQEIAADRMGVELALKAGFSRLRGLKPFRRLIDLGLDLAPIEPWMKGDEHPSCKERLAELDKDQAPLWKAMAAFHNGTYFLMTEQYDSAEACFREVTREFPGCYEAWANLGYTLLMKYCDKLDTDDLRRFDLGQLVIGAFDRAPKSLRAQVRGIDADLWWDAVGALREALRLKPGLIVAQCNLGVAYLVSPEGKDVGKAAKYLSQAAEAAQADKKMDEFDLRLMFSLNDVNGIPTEGKGLIIVAVVRNVLHFRIFDGDGTMVVDTDEQWLTGQARQLEGLRKQLESLWPPHELTKSDKGRVATAVTSIVGYTQMDPLLRAVVLINAGVADLAGDHPDSAIRIFQGIEQDAARLPSWVSGTLHYNRAFLLSGSTQPTDRQSAHSHLEAYLRSSGQTSAWWPLAYERYLRVCKALNQVPKTKEELRRQSLVQLRPLSTVELGPDKKKVSLSERMVAIQGRLGDARPVPVVARTNLARLHYPELGVEVLGTDQVLAICLRGPKAPVLTLQGTGPATQRRSIRIGMKQQELDDILIDAAYPVFRELDVPGVNYRFYRDLGLAVLVRNGVVEELVIVRLPTDLPDYK